MQVAMQLLSAVLYCLLPLQIEIPDLNVISFSISRSNSSPPLQVLLCLVI